MLSGAGIRVAGAAGISLILAIAFSAPQVAARDLNKCPLGYASCSGIKDVSPVCCACTDSRIRRTLTDDAPGAGPEGCSCARAEAGYAFCLNKESATRRESPCCASTYPP